MFKIIFTLFATLFFTLLLDCYANAAPKLVRVGAYPFLPFMDKSSGITPDLIAEINAFQNDIKLEFVLTSPNRRYNDMATGRFTMMFFENIKWGWDPKLVESSKVFLKGDGEVYVTRNIPGRGQEYFDELKGKEIMGVLGYHYGFANFEADRAKLLKKYRMSFSSDNGVILRNFLLGYGDIAILSKSFLSDYLLKNPQVAGRLLISQRLDQEYFHTILVKSGSKPTAQEIDALLSKMESAGILKKIWKKYGIDH
jgi:polar amino acid transport system substrate-binding protein